MLLEILGSFETLEYLLGGTWVSPSRLLCSPLTPGQKGWKIQGKDLRLSDPEAAGEQGSAAYLLEVGRVLNQVS